MDFAKIDWRRLKDHPILVTLGILVTIGSAIKLVASFWPAPPLPSITKEEIDRLHAQGFYYAAQIRKLPMAASIYREDLHGVAEKLWADPRYARQAPRETALVYRLYAATILFGSPSSNILYQTKSSLAWLRKAIELDKKTKDYLELKSAEQFFSNVADGKVPSVNAEIMLTHQLRVAMPEANPAEIEARVQEAIKIIRGNLTPRTPGGSSAKEDFEYLSAYAVGDYSLGQVMKTLQTTLRGRFPQKDVGGDPIFFPLPNGNTKIQYPFHGAETQVYEWEVNRAKKLIRPLNDASRRVMELTIRR